MARNQPSKCVNRNINCSKTRLMVIDEVYFLCGWVNQAYSRLSTTHGHITDCYFLCVSTLNACAGTMHKDTNKEIDLEI